MSASSLEEKALRLFRTFEHAGKNVNRVTVEGRRIVLDLGQGEVVDDFEEVDMRHGKT
ncbi:hypothetical protein [Pseudoprimorskyibacter insulae]|uniref:Uncharacterized protein n=1 Tax=Pseudoprimorskyibacter insulae TaxID=1695997 RepID=A0A2R8B0W3_9RHOB|nr:hypothetical protein [Pseudoprimorskyibacter insulae]SPF81935.1 hypothetical protein PRI8871_03762 [Pseudoprimorskyibacter insulae]